MGLATAGRCHQGYAAGAVAGPGLLETATRRGLDPYAFLANNDAYSFFEPFGALMKTGATGTNVRDVRLVLGRGGA